MKEAKLVYNFWKRRGLEVRLLTDDPRCRPMRGIAMEASKEVVLEAIKDGGIFHYIGHTLLDNRGRGYMIAGKDSEDVISPEDMEAYRNDFSNLSLAFLSSCASAFGFLSDFRKSLALPFLKLGVPSVIATQYDISDDLTCRRYVVEGFYQRYVQGMSIDQALTDAEREVAKKKQKEYEPSGYILLGSYLNPLRL